MISSLLVLKPDLCLPCGTSNGLTFLKVTEKVLLASHGQWQKYTAHNPKTHGWPNKKELNIELKSVRVPELGESYAILHEFSSDELF